MICNTRLHHVHIAVRSRYSVACDATFVSSWLPATCLLLWLAFLCGRTSAQSWPLFPIEVDGELGLIDENGTVVVEPQFTCHETHVVGACLPEGPRLFSWSDGMAVVWKNDKAGYVNSKGEVVIEPQFEMAGRFCDGCAYVSNSDGGVVMIDKHGRVLQAGLEDVRRPEESVAVVKKDGLWGLVDVESGAFLIEPECTEMLRSARHVAANRKGAWGITDLGGRTVLPFDYESVRIIGSLAVVVQDHKCGIYDLAQRRVTAPIKFETIGVFSEGLFAFRKDRKWGFIDSTGTVLIPPDYDSVYRFKGARGWGLKASQHCLFDRNGRAIAYPDFDSILHQGEGYTIVCREVVNQHEHGNKKCAVIDTHGNFIVPFKYESIREYANGRAVVRLNGKDGIIDRAGREVLTPSLDFIRAFCGDLAIASRRGRVGLIGRDGQWICEPRYRTLSRESGGCRVAQIRCEGGNREYVGYTDSEGRLLFSSEDWGEGDNFIGELAKVETISEGPAYIDRQGEIVWSWQRHKTSRNGGALRSP